MKEYFSLGLNYVDKRIYFQEISSFGDLDVDSDGFLIHTYINEEDFSKWFNDNNPKPFSLYEKEKLEKAALKTKDDRFIDLIFSMNDYISDIKNQIEEIMLLKEII